MTGLKLNPIPAFIAIAIGALVGWAYYELANRDAPLELLGIVTGILSALSLIGIIGIDTTTRATASIRVLSGLFLCISLLVNAVFACFKFSVPLFVILNVTIALLGIYLVYNISERSNSV